MKPDDICPRPRPLPHGDSAPLAEPIQLSTVYRCRDPEHADALLSGAEAGYVYRRDSHPNADALAAQCRALHGAEEAAACGSGMSALAAIVLAHLQAGDHLVVSDQLYGRSLTLARDEAARLGVECTVVDALDAEAVAAALRDNTRLLLVETIANPTLAVADIAALAKVAHGRGALLVVDNTFASPALCRPLERGADLVYESITKIMNGHSDVLLGVVCGPSRHWQRMRHVIATWGLMASPLECWLAARGIGTLALRAERAGTNAEQVAQRLARSAAVSSVRYPGLAAHPQHELARRQFGGRYGAMVTFTLAGGAAAAARFIHAAHQIPFAPSLGELSTTLSHPCSTSHRALSADQRQRLGICEGMIRLSIGVESADFILAALDEGLAAV